MNHSDFMQHAITLAEKGRGWTNPNPLVGCVIVKDGQIIAEGYHARYGGGHAERNAILSCQADLQGATLYVTLAPCCHYGKTPPCTDLIIARGIQRVVVGSADPNPIVAEKGILQLRQAGIEVIEGVKQAECEALNPIFFHFIQQQRPYVLLKYAMSADGKIATKTGQARWITGALARQRVHQTRHEYRAIMVGIGTVLADDPLLTCRLPHSRQPIRVICDSQLRTPLQSQLVQTARQYRTLIATCEADPVRWQAYQAFGVERVLCAAEKASKRIDLRDLLQKLGALGIDSLLLEGGSTLNFSAVASGLVNRVHCYIAPKLIGGKTAKTPIDGAGFEQIHHALPLSAPRVERLGDDILFDFQVVY